MRTAGYPSPPTRQDQMLRPPEGKAGLLAAQWNEELPAWVDGMRSYAENLRRSAEVYESNDSAAERAFGGVPGGRRPI